MANVVEQGDLFFVYRRRVGAPHVHSLRDVQRLFLVLGSHPPRERLRVFSVGKKHLEDDGLRHIPGPELAGEGAYRLVVRDDHASELVYALEQPTRLGRLLSGLGLHPEGRLIIALRNPDLGGLGGDRWLPIDDPHLLDYPYAQLRLLSERGKPLALSACDAHANDEVQRLLGGRVGRPLLPP